MLTAALRKGAKNTIVVRVDSPIDPGFTGRKTMPKGQAMDDIAMPYLEEGCMGGIYRSVRLQGRGDVSIEDAWAQSKVSERPQTCRREDPICVMPPNAESRGTDRQVLA